MISFSDQGTQAHYYFFSRLWSRCLNAFEKTSDSECIFQTGSGRINLMGIRGLASWEISAQAHWESIQFDKTSVFDDSMLVLSWDSHTPRAEHFAASLQYGNRSADLEKSQDIRPGVHKYHFGFHKQKIGNNGGYSERQPLAIKNPQTGAWHDARNQNPLGHKYYRALRPKTTVLSYKDVNRDGRLNAGDTIANHKTVRGHDVIVPLEEAGHNIHAGNTDEKPSGATGGEGCQVINGWGRFPWLRDSYSVKTPFYGYVSARLEDDRRPNRGMIQTNVPSNQVTLARGDKFRLVTDPFLIQQKQPWGLIEKYFAGATHSELATPLRYYVKDADRKKKSDVLAEWKTKDLLKQITDGKIILAESAFGHAVTVDAGAPLWVSGEGPIADGTLGTFLHWSIFSTEKLFPTWKEMKDDTADTVIEDHDLLGWIKAEPSFSGKIIEAKNIRDFYTSPDPSTHQRVQELRKYAIRCQSEWVDPLGDHIGKLQKMAELENRKLDESQYKACANPFRWWGEVAASLNLPVDGKVWHYNPIQCLWELSMIEPKEYVDSPIGNQAFAMQAV